MICVIVVVFYILMFNFIGFGIGIIVGGYMVDCFIEVDYVMFYGMMFFVFIIILMIVMLFFFFVGCCFEKDCDRFYVELGSQG